MAFFSYFVNNALHVGEYRAMERFMSVYKNIHSFVVLTRHIGSLQ